MAKLKLRIFQFCRKNHQSTSPEHPAPQCQRRKIITVDFPCTTPPPPPSKQSPHRSSFKSRVSSAFRRRSSNSGNHPADDDNFQLHVVTKLYDVVSPRPKIYRSSIIAGVISDEERFQLPPRGGFSTDYNMDGGGRGGVSPEWGSPARLSVFKKVMACKVDGKVKESFAVVKRSENPYEDFKKSMMDMIVEREMHEESDLKQLLQCFLSLNSRYHHGVIMEVFSEIWDTMFYDN